MTGTTSRLRIAMNSDLADIAESGTVPTTPILKPSCFRRFKRAFGPVLPGMILDLADLFSLTRTVGLSVSFPIGMAIGVWLSLYYPFRLGWRCLIAIASGVYALTPGTEYIPLATILTCLGRFVEGGSEATKASPFGDAATSFASETAIEGTDERPRPDGRRVAPTRAACPECGSTLLKYGEVDQRFRPSGSSVWAKGHEINAFVCLDCGFVGHYLTSSDLDRLRSNGA